MQAGEEGDDGDGDEPSRFWYIYGGRNHENRCIRILHSQAKRTSHPKESNPTLTDSSPAKMKVKKGTFAAVSHISIIRYAAACRQSFFPTGNAKTFFVGRKARENRIFHCCMREMILFMINVDINVPIINQQRRQPASAKKKEEWGRENKCNAAIFRNDDQNATRALFPLLRVPVTIPAPFSHYCGKKNNGRAVPM